MVATYNFIDIIVERRCGNRHPIVQITEIVPPISLILLMIGQVIILLDCGGRDATA